MYKGLQGYTGVYKEPKRYTRVCKGLQGIQGYTSITTVCKGLQGSQGSQAYTRIYKGIQGFKGVSFKRNFGATSGGSITR